MDAEMQREGRDRMNRMDRMNVMIRAARVLSILFTLLIPSIFSRDRSASGPPVSCQKNKT